MRSSNRPVSCCPNTVSNTSPRTHERVSIRYTQSLPWPGPPRCWIKLASLYRLSSEPYPHRDMLPMRRDLVALVPLWLPDSRAQQLALVDTPALLYGFEPLR